MTRGPLIGLLLSAGAAVAFGQTPPLSLTLEGATRRALVHNTGLAVERENVEQAGFAILGARGARQNDLTDARVTETSALTDYRKAATEFARATGVLLEERGIKTDVRTP